MTTSQKLSLAWPSKTIGIPQSLTLFFVEKILSVRLYIYGEDGFTNITLANSLSILGLDVIGETDIDVVALGAINRHIPDVVLFNVDHGHLKAVEIAKNVRKHHPQTGIVLATKTRDIRLIGLNKKDLPLGVVITQMVKHNDLDNLKDAIYRSIDCVSCESELHFCDFLSDCQIETFRLMAEGNANSEIAKLRYVSEKSVEQMLARIAMNMGISFDHKQNTRVRLLNSYYELVNGRK